MMREIVGRHDGILPVDIVESIWRVIIATFTHVQAPYTVHGDTALGGAAMRDVARFHFGFVVPYETHDDAADVIHAVAASRGDLGLVPVAAAGSWWRALEAPEAPKIIARLPFVERADHPAALPTYVVSKPIDEAAAVSDVRLVLGHAGRRRRRRCRPDSTSSARAGAALLVALHRRDDDAATAGRSACRPGASSGPSARMPRPSSTPPRQVLIAMSVMPADRPRPRAGILTSSPMCPASPARPASPRSGSCRPTRRRSGRARRPGPPMPRRPRRSSSILTARPARCARRSPPATASIRRRILCGAGSDELLSFLANAYLSPGDEALFSAHGFLVYKIVTLAAGAVPVAAPETNLTADVDALLARGHGADENRLPRQSQQSDRHLSAVRRGQAPACRAAARHPAGARCRLCRICPAQRLRGRAGARRDGAKRRDDADLLEDPRPCRACGSAGWSGRRI